MHAQQEGFVHVLAPSFGWEGERYVCSNPATFMYTGPAVHYGVHAHDAALWVGLYVLSSLCCVHSTLTVRFLAVM